MRYDKKLVIIQDGEEKKITLYTDPNEVSLPRVVLKNADNMLLYARFTDIENVLASSVEIDMNAPDYPKRIAEKITHLFRITQEPRETITVTADGVNHTEDFVIDHSTRYEVRVEAIPGWDPGVIHPVTSGIANDDISVSVGDAVREKYAITVPYTRGQIITVHSKGNDYTSSFTAEFEDEYTTTIESEYGFNHGEIENPSGIFTGETTITATPPTRVKFTVHIEQSENQVITVTANGESHISDFEVDYETPFTVTVEGDYGYDPGTPNFSDGIVEADMTISASEATLKRYPVTITQSENQVITVHYNDEDYTTDFIATHGYPFTATVEGNFGYNPGRLTPSAGSFTGPVEFTVTAAKLKTYNITVSQSENQTIVVNTNGTSYTKNFTVTHGDTYTATVTPASGWDAGTLSSSAGTFTGPMTFSVTSASRSYAAYAYTGGSFTFTVPTGVSTLRVTIIGGGGGGSTYSSSEAYGTGNHAGGTGGSSYITIGSTQYTCTGGGGGNVYSYYSYSSEGYDYYSVTPYAGGGGSPSGRSGTTGRTGSGSGGAGYALGNGGTYGTGGSASGSSWGSSFATGGGGGYRRFTVAVTEGATYSGYVGGGGGPYRGSYGSAYSGSGGGIYIEYGGGI